MAPPASLTLLKIAGALVAGVAVVLIADTNRGRGFVVIQQDQPSARGDERIAERALQRRLSASAEDVRSLMRLIASRMDASIQRLLGD